MHARMCLGYPAPSSPGSGRGLCQAPNARQVCWPLTGLQSWAAGRAAQKPCRSRSPPRGGDGQSAVAPVSVGCEADRMRKGRVRSFCRWVGRKAATRGLTERRQPQHWTIRDGASTPASKWTQVKGAVGVSWFYTVLGPGGACCKSAAGSPSTW